MIEKVKVGHGWFDEKVPHDIAKLLQIHQPGHGKECTISIHCDSHVQMISGGDYMLYDSTRGAEGLAQIFRGLDTFVEVLENEHADVTSLMIMNFKASTFSAELQPRPKMEIREVEGFRRGFAYFVHVVKESFAPKSMWSSCEWAMLTVSKEP